MHYECVSIENEYKKIKPFLKISWRLSRSEIWNFFFLEFHAKRAMESQVGQEKSAIVYEFDFDTSLLE